MSSNNCSLDKCSSDRIVRLVANGARGTIFKLNDEDEYYFINYSASFDSQIQFVICDLPQEFQPEANSGGIEIIYSGDLIDACGSPQFLWPIEKTYYLLINQIKRS